MNKFDDAILLPLREVSYPSPLRIKTILVFFLAILLFLQHSCKQSNGSNVPQTVPISTGNVGQPLPGYTVSFFLPWLCQSGQQPLTMGEDYYSYSFMDIMKVSLYVLLYFFEIVQLYRESKHRSLIVADILVALAKVGLIFVFIAT